MSDNDDLTYSYQKRAVASSAERSLISLERSQKLDLLLHLLANLQQSLIVCGPEGIGKTTLLAAVQQSRKDLWEVVLLTGSANSSFESIVADVLRHLNIARATDFDISALRAACARQKVVLLIDDAGNLVPGLMTMLMELAYSLPGLRIAFALNHDQYHIKSGTDKLVEECHFIELPPLTKKQCGDFLQNLSAQPGAVVSYNAITDSLIEDLYRDTHGIPGKILAELPKLAHYQTRKASRIGLWLAIAAVLAASGYAVTFLLPPEITSVADAVIAPVSSINTVKTDIEIPATPAPVQQVPDAPTAVVVKEPDSAPTPATSPVVASAAVTPEIKPDPKPAVALVPPKPEPAPEPAITPTVATTSAPQPTLKPVPPPVVASSPNAAEIKPEPQPAPLPTVTPVQPKPEPTPQPAITTSVATTPAPIEAVTQSKPETTPPEPPLTATPAAEVSATAAESSSAKPPERKPAKPADQGSDQDWIMAQPPGNYTLQVMVLSNKLAALRFQKKYADYRDGLKFYAINKGEQEKYVVIYGSFQTAAQAMQLKAALPGEFKQALEKRFKAVQNESRR